MAEGGGRPFSRQKRFSPFQKEKDGHRCPSRHFPLDLLNAKSVMIREHERICFSLPSSSAHA